MGTKKMRECAPLLPAPCNEGVLELLGEIERLRAVFTAARAVLRYDGADVVLFNRAMVALNRAVMVVLSKDQGGE